MDDPYDGLFRAIGRVVYEWSWLENDIAHFVFDLCALQSPAFYDDIGVGFVSGTLAANVDLKANITIAKTLAHKVEGRDGFFERVEAVLNLVGNEMRSERNRYVHDIWYVVGGNAHRIKHGSFVRREKGSGKTDLEFSVLKHFQSIAEVEAFADKVHDQRKSVMALQDEAQGIYRLQNKIDG